MRQELRRLSGVEVIQVMMTFRPDWTVFEDNHDLLRVIGRYLPIQTWPVLLFLACL
jgi:hypothetical protein